MTRLRRWKRAFPQHPDAEIILGFPGLGVQLGARVLAEIGHDHNRFADARSLKAYSGSSPTTRASGRLYHCLQPGRRLDEVIAFPSSPALVVVVQLASSATPEAAPTERRS